MSQGILRSLSVVVCRRKNEGTREKSRSDDFKLKYMQAMIYINIYEQYRQIYCIFSLPYVNENIFVDSTYSFPKLDF